MEQTSFFRNILKEKYNYYADYQRLWEKPIEDIKRSAKLPKFEKFEVRPGTGIFALNYTEPLSGEIRFFDLAEKCDGDNVVKGFLDLAGNFQVGEYDGKDPLTLLYKGEISFDEFPEIAVPDDDGDFDRFVSFIQNIVCDAVYVMGDRARKSGFTHIDDELQDFLAETLAYAQNLAETKLERAIIL